MKRLQNLVLCLALMVGMMAQAATGNTPKREFRSAWVATVWCRNV